MVTVQAIRGMCVCGGGGGGREGRGREKSGGGGREELPVVLILHLGLLNHSDPVLFILYLAMLLDLVHTLT